MHIEEGWSRRSALEDLLGVPPENVHADRLYEGLDQRLPHKEAIEKHLRERLGRRKERDWRASHVFDITLEPLAPPQGKSHLRITWQRNSRFADWSSLSAGWYLLRNNLTDVDAPTLWRRYIQLTEAEWAFRITKDELAIRPVWHQKEDRVKAHILVCFLAYVPWKTLAGRTPPRSGGRAARVWEMLPIGIYIT